MNRVFLLLAAALLLIFLSGRVATWGIDYDLRGLTAAERMSVSDTTTIGEKWAAAGFGMLGCGLLLLSLAGFFYYKAQDKFLPH
jgi:hypothetical protein